MHTPRGLRRIWTYPPSKTQRRVAIRFLLKLGMCIDGYYSHGIERLDVLVGANGKYHMPATEAS